MFIRDLMFGLVEEEVGQKSRFEGKRCDWGNEPVTHHAQSFKQSAQVTKPVQQAISLPVDNKLVSTDADFKTGEFVTCVWVLFGRVNVPRTGHR